MPLLIDGYNLLHVTALFGRGTGPGGFHRSRLALLDFLAARLSPAERERTTIVFDSAEAPPNLPHTYRHEAMLVRFARGYPSADALIEELIAADHAPRQLVVVSSDHRVQNAARRRRATAVDSDRWFADLRTRDRSAPDRETGHKPGELGEADVTYWLGEFADAETVTLAESENPFPPRPRADHRPPSNQATSPPTEPDRRRAKNKPPASRRPTAPLPRHRRPPPADFGEGIFPPGYGEDIEE